jgi:3-phenylpropionate/cinnamic acid dioxygenase small subunit
MDMSVEQVVSAPSRFINGARTNAPVSLKDEIEQFLYRQSEFLDSRNWEGWIGLFAKTGLYWIPAHPDDPSPEGRPCICCEDRYLMRTRMKRLRHPKAWSQLPPHRTSHVVSNVSILDSGDDTGVIVAQSRFHMVELRWDKQRYLAGRYQHHLVRVDEDFQVNLQRVDLLNYDAPMDYVLQSWV